MHNHLVEFYETDSLLVDSVRDFFTPALEEAEPVIVVATPEHRAPIARAVEALGVDVPAARREGRFVELDAAETLSSFMAGSAPDPDRFDQVVGGLVRRMGPGSHKLRIYGEMVALLWSDGNRSAALQLENLWNNLSDQHPFSLLCAYPMASMEWGANTAPFRGICSTHSSVRLRFDVPAAGVPFKGKLDLPADGIKKVQELGDELTALKEVIRKVNQMERLADSDRTVRQAGPGGLDFRLTL